MITKVNDNSTFPADSFVNVACVLHDRSNLSESYDCGIVSELTECKQEDVIMEQVDSVLVSYNSFDVDAIDDIKDSIQRKDRAIHFLIIVIIFMACVFGYLLGEVISQKQLVRELELKVNELHDEMNKVTSKFNNNLGNFDILDLSNCYFNFKAAASVGVCGEEYSNTISSWYQWGSENFQSIFSSLFKETKYPKSAEDSPLETELHSDLWWSTWTFENLSAYFATNTESDWLHDIHLED